MTVAVWGGWVLDTLCSFEGREGALLCAAVGREPAGSRWGPGRRGWGWCVLCELDSEREHRLGKF